MKVLPVVVGKLIHKFIYHTSGPFRRQKELYYRVCLHTQESDLTTGASSAEVSMDIHE